MQDIINDCRNLKNIIEEAVSWAGNNLPDERKKSTLFRLEYFRRLSMRYEASATRKPSVALYGQSQAGKSYLVSNLAKPASSNKFWVEVPWQDNKKFDFINQINPFGKEKESTGLVTRFTLASEAKRKGKFSFLLRTFKQSDIVTIIANAYFSNIGKKVFKIDKEDLMQTIGDLRALIKNTDMKQEFNVDDVFEVKEYLDEKFLGSKSAGILEDLNSLEFFESISRIIPYIHYDQRWRLFQYLWGKHEFYNKLFNTLSSGLAKIEFANEVMVAENGLIPRENSIIDVTRYYGIIDKTGIAGDPDVEVELNSGSAVSIDRAVLSGIVSEIVLFIPTENAHELPFLEHADILDFPGARPDGDMDEDKFISENNQKTSIEHFLRGKLNFLFDRYNRDYEISNLILCWPIKQPNVIKIRKLINEWIKNNIGRTPEKREERLMKLQTLLNPDLPYRVNPLLVVMTMFDEDLKVKAGEDPGSPARWEGRFKENYSKWLQHEVDSWLDNWDISGTSTFKHTFPIRDPKYSNEIFEGFETSGFETGIREEYSGKLDALRNSFVGFEYVKRHLLNPSEAWDELLTDKNKEKGFNTGIDYVIRYITPVCNGIIKHEQLREKILELKTGLLEELEQYFEGGDINEKLKKAKTNGLKSKIAIEKLHDEKCNFGLLLSNIVCPEELAWKEYWKLKNEEVVNENNSQIADSEDTNPELTSQIIALQKLLDRKGISAEPGKDKYDEVIKKLMENENIDDNDILFEVYSSNGYNLERIKDILAGNVIDIKADEADNFSKNLISAWLYLISSQKAVFLTDSIGLPKNITDLIVDQLSRNIERVNLKKLMAGIVRDEVKAYHVTQNQNFDLVARLSCNLLNSFITTAGWVFIDVEKRPKVDKGNEKIFSDTDNLRFPKKNELQPGQVFPGQRLYDNWKVGLRESFEANVLYESNMQNAEKAISNQKLGEIINKTTAIK